MEYINAWERQPYIELYSLGTSLRKIDNKKKLYKRALEFYLAGKDEEKMWNKGEIKIEDIMPRIKEASKEFQELDPENLVRIFKEITEDGINWLWQSYGYQLEAEKTVDYLRKEKA